MTQATFNFDDNDNNDGEPPFSDSIAFGKVRKYFDANVDDGLHCPLCKQFAKIYKRKLNKTMVKALRLLYKAGATTQFVHAPTVLAAHAAPAREVGKLAYFNLTKEETERREDGGKSGWWMVTKSGIEFLRGRLTVQKYAVVYDGVVTGYKGGEVNITGIAPDFRFDDLMNDE